MTRSRNTFLAHAAGDFQFPCLTGCDARVKFMTLSLRLPCVISVCWLVTGCHPVTTPSRPTASVPSPNHNASPALAPANSSAVASATKIRFEDRTSQARIHFTYHNDEERKQFAILEMIGGGIGVIDYDSDGRLDLMFAGGGRYTADSLIGLPSALFRNLGEVAFDEDHSFTDVTLSAQCGSATHYSHGISVADFNEDGFPDLLVTGYGGVMLYRNEGDGTFTDETAKSGLCETLWSVGAAWGDLNGDGTLDLYVAHYMNWSRSNNPHCDGPTGVRDSCPPRLFESLPDAVYFGNGEGAFRDATLEVGLRTDGKGLSVVLADLDLDGDLDVYVTNDAEPNFLYVNDGHGRLEDISLSSGTSVSDRGTPDASMGADIADFNADGLPDIWVTNYENENFALYRNLGQGIYRHVSQSVGIAAIGDVYVGWGTRFFDADLDGDEDLVVANGHVNWFPKLSPKRQHPLLLESQAGRRFVNVALNGGDYMSSPHQGRGLVTGDWDGDGDEDLAISHINEPVVVLTNETRRSGHWLAVRVIGRDSCRSSIGAIATTTISGTKQTRHVRGGSSFASTSDLTLHFGCGDVELVDELRVIWLSGRSVVLRDVPCNHQLTIVEPPPAASVDGSQL